jgi:hypothetical protein
MKVYGEVDVQIHIFLTSAIVGGQWSASHPCCFTMIHPRYMRKKFCHFFFEAAMVTGEISLAKMENTALPKAYPGSGLIRWYTT